MAVSETPSPASLEAARKLHEHQLFRSQRVFHHAIVCPSCQEFALALDAHARAAVEKEREEIAVMVETEEGWDPVFQKQEYGRFEDVCDLWATWTALAAAIRSRGRAQEGKEGVGKGSS